MRDYRKELKDLRDAAGAELKSMARAIAKYIAEVPGKLKTLGSFTRKSALKRVFTDLACVVDFHRRRIKELQTRLDKLIGTVEQERAGAKTTTSQRHDLRRIEAAATTLRKWLEREAAQLTRRAPVYLRDYLSSRRVPEELSGTPQRTRPPPSSVPLFGSMWNGGVHSVARTLRKETSKEQLRKRLRPLIDRLVARLAKTREAHLGAEEQRLLASQVTRYVIDCGISVKALRLATELVDDICTFSYEKLMFADEAAQLEKFVVRVGGLHPGEDVIIKAALAQRYSDLETRRSLLKIKWDFDGKLRPVFNSKLLFLKSATGEAGFRLEKKHFRTRVFTRLTWNKPLVKGASLDLTGGAEIRWDGIEASVKGTVYVHDLYINPRLGRVADIEVKAGYSGSTVKAGLSGRFRVPLDGKWSHDKSKADLALQAYMQVVLREGMSLNATAESQLFRKERDRWSVALFLKVDF